jgi:hypothetical protein
MPRGSKPGERRGGRQKGSPNKKTVLRNAALSAAAADPNVSPLDYLLNVMREQTLPLETRIAAAREALPYFHSKPQESVARQATPGRYGNASLNGNSSPTGQQSINIRIFKGGSAPEESDRETGDQRPGSDEVQKHVHPKALPDTSMTPLEFLLGVMRDPDTPTNLRLRIASLVARYVHPRHTGEGPRKIIVDDPTGFKVDPAIAMELRDAKRRYDLLNRTSFTEPEQYKREAPGLSARIYQIEKKLECPCPSLYGENELNRDGERLEELARVRESGRKLSAHEDIEEAWLTARVASWSTVPEWAARGRFHQLDERRWDDGWKHGPPLNLREQAEFRALRTAYPLLPVEKTFPEEPQGDAKIAAALARRIRDMRVAVRFQRS